LFTRANAGDLRRLLDLSRRVGLRRMDQRLKVENFQSDAYMWVSRTRKYVLAELMAHFVRLTMLERRRAIRSGHIRNWRWVNSDGGLDSDTETEADWR